MDLYSVKKMFYDEVRLKLKAGDGGNGCISFRREKFIPFGGPDGGNGGKGADIIIRADGHTNGLVAYKYKYSFVAKNGGSGMGKCRTGAGGDDLILKVPVGTQIFNDDLNTLLHDLHSEGMEVIIAKGGGGGGGNINFKSSINKAPRRAGKGKPGDEVNIQLRLKLMCDVGIVGKPNAGKSTFLSVYTNAKPKIADYPFTTLSPNLGIVDLKYDTIVIADIPGLIQGASLGQGLGDKFLKHIERCKVILHLIDSSAPDPISDYLTIIQELKLYDQTFEGNLNYQSNLLQKPQIIALNKTDIVEPKTLTKLKKALQKLSPNSNILTLSSLTDTDAQKNKLIQIIHATLTQITPQAQQQIYISTPPAKTVDSNLDEIESESGSNC